MFVYIGIMMVTIATAYLIVRVYLTHFAPSDPNKKLNPVASSRRKSKGQNQKAIAGRTVQGSGGKPVERKPVVNHRSVSRPGSLRKPWGW